MKGMAASRIHIPPVACLDTILLEPSCKMMDSVLRIPRDGSPRLWGFDSRA
jgi:hypothetical protein